MQVLLTGVWIYLIYSSGAQTPPKCVRVLLRFLNALSIHHVVGSFHILENNSAGADPSAPGRLRGSGQMCQRELQVSHVSSSRLII